MNINGIGILFDAKPGNDYCNGSIASIVGGPVVAACLCDCLHLDDVGAILGRNKRECRRIGCSSVRTSGKWNDAAAMKAAFERRK